jgi:hypothetical protein
MTGCDVCTGWALGYAFSSTTITYEQLMTLLIIQGVGLWTTTALLAGQSLGKIVHVFESGICSFGEGTYVYSHFHSSYPRAPVLVLLTC